jgi:hypothetical protein
MVCCNNSIKDVPYEFLVEVDSPSVGYKMSPGNESNWGLTKGRMESYPVGYLCFSYEDAEEMVRSGLAWRGGKDDHCRTICVGCWKYISWRAGMVVDEEHRKLSPDCPWLARRDRGLDMELHCNWKMPDTLLLKYHDGVDIDIVCIKCDVTFPYINVPIEYASEIFSYQEEVYEKMHNQYNPYCK